MYFLHVLSISIFGGRRHEAKPLNIITFKIPKNGDGGRGDSDGDGGGDGLLSHVASTRRRLAAKLNGTMPQ